MWTTGYKRRLNISPIDGNQNGVCVLRNHVMGRYELFTAHHQGQFIRWYSASTITSTDWSYLGSFLDIKDTLSVGHIASPFVYFDDEGNYTIIFHGDDKESGGQVSFIAKIDSTTHKVFGIEKYVDDFYYQPLRNQTGAVIQHNVGIAKRGNESGIFYRGLSPWVKVIPKMRHANLLSVDNRCHIFYTRIGDNPEHIRCAVVDLFLEPDQFITHDFELLRPTEVWEGSLVPPSPSTPGMAHGLQKQLRDPFVYPEDGRYYLFYIAGGEQNIGVAEIFKI